MTYKYGQSAEPQRLQRLQQLIVDAEGTLKRLQGDASAAQSIIDHAKAQQEAASKAERRRDNMAQEALELEKRAARAEHRRVEAKREVWDTNPDEYEHARQQAAAKMTIAYYNAGTARLAAAASEAARHQYTGNKVRNIRDDQGRYTQRNSDAA